VNIIRWFFKTLAYIITGCGVTIVALCVFMSPAFLFLYLFPDMGGDNILFAIYGSWILIGLFWLIGGAILDKSDEGNGGWL
jgi:hypothetical protein